MNEFYSVDDVAEIWKISNFVVRREIKSGRLKAIRLGTGSRSCYRIYRKELDRYMAEEYEKQKERVK